MNNSNYSLYARDDVFDEQILNLDATPRLNAIDFSDSIQEIVINSSDNGLQSVLHNHTYTIANSIQTSDTLVSNSSKSNQSKSTQSKSTQPKSTSASTANSSPPTHVRPQATRRQAAADTLNAIRARRLFENTNSTQNSFDLISVTSETDSLTEEERSLSRDEKKAKDLQISISVCEIINMPIDEFNECLAKHDFNEQQLTLIRDIRRRGKNKVAAQNCRKRKINQIVGLQSEVDNLQTQKHDLLSYYDKLFAIKELAENKYQKLYDFIYERSQTNAALLASFELNFRLGNTRRNQSEIGAVGGLNKTDDENNTNQLNEMHQSGDLMMFKNLTKIDIKHKVQSNYKKALAMN